MAHLDLPGITLLTHSPQGLRIELNFQSAGLLEIWISPRPVSSRSHHDRNFSNRDDHTRLFDRIFLPGLRAEDFLGCRYDPFHLVAEFQRQILHLVPLADLPAVALWCEAAQRVDLKSDKADRPVALANDGFLVEHPDRGEVFIFAAISSTARFFHQPVVEEGRSLYASVELPSGAPLLIGGFTRLEKGIMELLAARSRRSPEEILATNELAVEPLLRPGRFRLRGQPEWQRLLDNNRRVLAAMQDYCGAIRAALNRIYYLIWVRDGSMIEVFQAQAGNAAALRRWTDFLLFNPTVIKDQDFPGKTFLMLVNPITKWEEDGVFFAIWSAFMAWTQTGEEAILSPARLRLLDDAMDWLERYCYDSARGLFGRYYYCETPLPRSRDDGYDNAVGMKTAPTDCRIGGKEVRRSYDVYINQLAYAAYRMLEAMHRGKKKSRYAEKASALREALRPFYTQVASGQGSLPDYGDLLLEDGTFHRAPPYGLDKCDYIWAFSLPPFVPFPEYIDGIRDRLQVDLMEQPRNNFLAAWFSLLAALDGLNFPCGRFQAAVDYAARQCYRPGRFLAMPDSVVEMTDIPDGHSWHDVRPQAFSVGPWLAALTGRGVRRLPFGLAVRPNSLVEEIFDYEWQLARVHFTFQGSGEDLDLVVNGKIVQYSWQIPEVFWRAGDNTVEVLMKEKLVDEPVLLSSTLLLHNLQTAPDLCYEVESFGVCECWFRGLEDKSVDIRPARGRQALAYKRHDYGSRTLLQTDYCGALKITIQRKI